MKTQNKIQDQFIDFNLAQTEAFQFILFCNKTSLSIFTIVKDEDPEPLRNVYGAHTDICLLRVDSYLCLVVTGTSKGELGVWSLENS